MKASVQARLDAATKAFLVKVATDPDEDPAVRQEARDALKARDSHGRTVEAMRELSPTTVMAIRADLGGLPPCRTADEMYLDDSDDAGDEPEESPIPQAVAGQSGQSAKSADRDRRAAFDRAMAKSGDPHAHALEAAYMRRYGK